MLRFFKSCQLKKYISKAVWRKVCNLIHDILFSIIIHNELYSECVL